MCNPKRGPYGVKYCGFSRHALTRPNLPKKFRTQSIDPEMFCYKEWQCVCGQTNLQVSSSSPRVLCLSIVLAPIGNIKPPPPPFPTLPPCLTLAWRPNNVGREAWARGNGENKFGNLDGYMREFEKLKRAYVSDVWLNSSWLKENLNLFQMDGISSTTSTSNALVYRLSNHTWVLP